MKTKLKSTKQSTVAAMLAMLIFLALATAAQAQNYFRLQNNTNGIIPAVPITNSSFSGIPLVWENELATTGPGSQPLPGGSPDYHIWSMLTNAVNNSAVMRFTNDLGTALNGGFQLNQFLSTRNCQITNSLSNPYSALVFMSDSGSITPTITNGGNFTIWNDLVLSNDLAINTGGALVDTLYGAISGTGNIDVTHNANNFLMVSNLNNTFVGNWNLNVRGVRFLGGGSMGSAGNGINFNGLNTFAYFMTTNLLGFSHPIITVPATSGFGGNKATLFSMTNGVNVDFQPGSIVLHTTDNDMGTYPIGATPNTLIYGMANAAQLAGYVNQNTITIGSTAGSTNWLGLCALAPLAGNALAVGVAGTAGTVNLSGDATLCGLNASTLNINNQVTGGISTNLLILKTGTVGFLNTNDNFASQLYVTGAGVNFAYTAGTFNYLMAAGGGSVFGAPANIKSCNLTLNAQPGEINTLNTLACTTTNGNYTIAGGIWNANNGILAPANAGNNKWWEVGNATGGTNNSLTLTAGAQVNANYYLLIGSGPRANNNRVYFSPNTYWDGLGGAICVGYNNGGVTNNSMVVDGAVVTNIAATSIGGTLAGANFSGQASNSVLNSLVIKNSGIYRFNTEISVGYSGFSNSLVVADAGSLISSNGLTGSANAAKIFVGRVVNSTGANPSTNYACDNNWMIISNGATVLCGPMFIGYPNPTSRATNNSVTIGGGNGSSVLAASVGIYVGVGTNAGFTGVGKGATNNYLLLKAGGIITNTGFIAVGTTNTSGSKLYFNGGTYAANANSAPIYSDADGQVFIQANGAVINDNGFLVTNNLPYKADPASTGGGLTKLGIGALHLAATNTYSGATTISAGTLVLDPTGSISNSTSIVIAAGATCDVSAFTEYALSAANSVSAIGAAGVPAVILGNATASITNVNFGTRPATLAFAPTSFSGDTLNPALTVSGGTLNLNGAVTVVNNAGTALGAGTYVIAQAPAGMTGTPTLAGVYAGGLGQGLAGGMTGAISVVGTDLVLTVTSGTATTTAIARHAGTGTSTIYGDAVSFDVSVTGPATGVVQLLDGATVIGTGNLVSGACVIAPALNALAQGAHSALTALYIGDATYGASTSSALSTQTVAQKILTVAGATAANKVYDGTTSASIAGASLVGVVSGDVVILGNVNTGTFADRNVGAGKSVAAAMTLSGAAAGNYALTQPTLAGTITAKPLSLAGLTAGAKVYDGTTAATFGGTAYIQPAEATGGISSAIDGKPYNVDSVSIGLATGVLASKDVGTRSIVTSVSLSGSGSGNYTMLQQPGLYQFVTARPITITAGTNTKIEDGNTSATNVPTLTAGTLAAGEGFATLSEVYTDAAVGTGKTLIPSATITNSASVNVSANYAITLVNDTTGVIVSAAPPVLSIAVVSTNAIVSWPSATDAGYALESATNLVAPAWVSAGSPTVVGTNNVVTNAVQPNAVFYHLKKP